MSSAGFAAPPVGLEGDLSPAADALSVDDELTTAAWACALPCALLTLLAVVVLGPPLGDLIAPGAHAYTPLPQFENQFTHEQTEHARYLLALGGPVLLVLALLLAPRWLPRVPRSVAARAAPVTQTVLVAAVAACVVGQYRMVFHSIAGPLSDRYFTPPTLVAAALLAAAAVAAIRRDALRERASALLRDSRARRAGALAAAVALTAVWMLHAVQSDATIGMAEREVLYHTAFTLDEAFAVLNGRTPLVDFTTQYGSLWPSLVALPMLAFGKTLLVYTLAMCSASAVALLTVYGVLRRVTRSAIGALALYLPFLATSLFLIAGTLVNRSTPGTYFTTLPSRYAGPFLLAWLTAWHIDRRSRLAGTWLLFAAGGLVALNNQDFGVPALGATIAALAWSASVRDRAVLRQLAVGLAGGLATAVALVCALTLAEAGSLPQFGRLTDYLRLFSVDGFGLVRITGVLGLHLVVYATYVAAIGVATVRAIRGTAGRPLTGMLAWSALFGLGSGAYFIGRSSPETLTWTFPAWALALALLTVVVVRQIAAQPTRRPTIAALLVLFGFGLAACSLAQLPLPWQQVARLNASFAPREEAPEPNVLVPPPDALTRTFVASLADGPSRFVYKRGAPVALLLTTGHRVADAYGVVDVAPYTGIWSMPTAERLDATLAALRAAGGNTVVLPDPLPVGVLTALSQRGFELVTDAGLRPFVEGRTRPTKVAWPDGGSVIKLVDTRHLHPGALQGS